MPILKVWERYATDLELLRSPKCSKISLAALLEANNYLTLLMYHSPDPMMGLG